VIHDGDTEAPSKLLHEKLTERVIGAAIELHRELGPGLMESAYEQCLCHELHLRGLTFERQMLLPVRSKGVSLDCEYPIDLVVEDAIPLELKRSEHILPVHEARLLMLKTNQQAGWTHPEFQGFGSEARWNGSNRSLILSLRASVPPW
jgi:GxxExxY protein